MNRIKSRKWRGTLVGVLLAILLLASQANAVLDLTFSEDIKATKGRIQFFWANENNGANQTGYSVSDAGLPLDLATNKAVADAASNTLIHFGCADSFPNSVTNYVRVWDTAAKDNFYTALGGYNNSAMGVVNASFNVAYIYVKAAPGVATITQYTENGTTVINPPSVTKTVTFTSTSPLVNGKTVEIAGSKWQLIQGATIKEVSGSGAGLTLNTTTPPPGITMNPGDKITLQVKHVNLWNQESPNWSAAYEYTVGAGGGGGGLPFALVLKSSVSTNGTGINNFGLPFGGPWYIGTSSIVTAYDLVKAINTVATTNVVSTFGQWDKTTQQLSGVMIVGNNPDGAAKTPLQAINLAQGEGYQVYLTKDVTVQIKSTP